MRTAPLQGRFLLFGTLLGLPILAVFTQTVSAEKPPPMPPCDLVATGITDTSVSLSWRPAEGAADSTRYLVYEYIVAVGVSDNTAYVVTGLKPGTRYVFAVKAKDAAGNVSVASDKLAVETTGTPPPPGPPPVKMVVAYYASWRAYHGYTPENLAGGKLTAVNYAFADIGKDLRLTVGDPAVDPGNFRALAQLKERYPHLLTFISLGGWDGSGRFSDVALTEASRAAFAESCLDFIVRYGFDGVDLDWEYPVSGGKAGNKKRPEDKCNFTSLLAALRAKLDAQGAKEGRRYYLTIAGAATPSYVRKYTEMGLVHQYVDWINLMTYDLHGKWDRFTDFGAALYENPDPSGQDKLFAASSVQYYLEAGVPPAKIVMGVPFYGRIYKGVADTNKGLYQRFQSCATLPAVEAAALYLDTPGYNRYWHTESMASWLFGGSTFIDCDDAESMEKKANYVRDKDLGGVMIWEISLDPNQVLLDALLDGLKATPE